MKLRDLEKIISGFVLLCLSGCGPAMKEWEPEMSKPVVHGISFRQSAPEPVYNRLRWAHLPEVLPSRELPESQAPLIKPLYHVQFKNVTLEQAAKILASAGKYSSYCASSITKQRVSLNILGTLEEIGQEIAKKTGVHAVIDHESKQIRFLARTASGPQFLN